MVKEVKVKGDNNIVGDNNKIIIEQKIIMEQKPKEKEKEPNQALGVLIVLGFIIVAILFAYLDKKAIEYTGFGLYEILLGFIAIMGLGVGIFLFYWKFIKNKLN